MTEPTKRASKGDADAAKLRDALDGLAEVLAPSDAALPILAPTVRMAVFEWLTEINARADLEKAGLKPRSSCLLFGPPGTGKTTLAHHLSARLGLPMVSVGSENLIGSYVGQSAKQVAGLFNALAGTKIPCVLFMDEIDTLAQKRTGMQGGGDERSSALTTLLRKVEGFSGILIAATNLKETIDPAMWRRFALQIELERPGFDERYAIIAKYLSPYTWDEDGIALLADYTENASPSLLRQLCENMKRSLILGPRLKRPIDSAADVLTPIVASISVPPGFAPPPLWTSTEKCLSHLAHVSWPPMIPKGDAT